ncbi:uncharacterized protein LOC133366813 [Rhineura floridana]|uniref:uncharacterized protein LOC133366813 n=1 Tax=Rhineura floridana TaxID=261503 RepID=UPI002AC81AC4|nr:uncharacterized protein LOC133366813 [Rhineura floridana]
MAAAQAVLVLIVHEVKGTPVKVSQPSRKTTIVIVPWGKRLNPQMISSVPPPPPPELSISPSRVYFARGEWVQLICSLPEGQRAVAFFFFEKPADDPQMISSVPPPPPPELSISPSRVYFARGEWVQLKCSLPEGQRAGQFFFYEKKADGNWTQPRSQKNNTLKLLIEYLGGKKTFTCSYLEENCSGQQSAQSNHVEFSITGSLPPASLSREPQQPVYTPGEKVTLICSAPEERDVAGYRFYKEQNSQSLKNLPNQRQGRYHVLPVNNETAGEYRCEYLMQESRQELQSPLSSPVSLSITDHPRPPVFSVGPKKDVYRTEESIKLRCSISERRHISKVQFFKDGGQLIEAHSSLNTSTYPLSLLPQHGGNYSCTYHIMESGREIPSGESNFIWISVLALPPPMMPKSSTPAWALPGATTTTSPPRMSTPVALPPASSQPAASHTVRMHSEHTEPLASSTFQSSFSQTNLHRRASASPSPQDSTKSPTCCDITDNSDPRSTRETKDGNEKGSSQPAPSHTIRMHSEHTEPLESSTPQTNSSGTAGPFLLWLAFGCAGAGGLILLLFLLCLCRRKYKDKREISARTYWETLALQQSLRSKRCPDPVGVAINLEERNKPDWLQPRSEDWGSLPKTKSPMSKLRHPSKEKREEETDSGAEFEFSEIDPTYTLLGFPCSTFFLEKNDEE